jgi:hypothetical protein
MKMLATLSVLFTAIIATPVYAQQPGTSKDPHHPEPMGDVMMKHARRMQGMKTR